MVLGFPDLGTPHVSASAQGGRGSLGVLLPEPSCGQVQEKRGDWAILHGDDMVMTWWWHAPKISQNGDATMTKYDSSVQTCGFNHQQWGFSHQEWWLNQQNMVVTWEYFWGSAMIFECFGEWRVPPEECLVPIQKEGLDLILFFLPDFAESAESEFITLII